MKYMSYTVIYQCECILSPSLLAFDLSFTIPYTFSVNNNQEQVHIYIMISKGKNIYTCCFRQITFQMAIGGVVMKYEYFIFYIKYEYLIFNIKLNIKHECTTAVGFPFFYNHLQEVCRDIF